MNSYQVTSSFISEVRFPQPAVVEVAMRSGRQYRYAEVPQETYELFQTAVEFNSAFGEESVGRMFNQRIRPLVEERLPDIGVTAS